MSAEDAETPRDFARAARAAPARRGSPAPWWLPVALAAALAAGGAAFREFLCLERNDAEQMVKLEHIHESLERIETRLERLETH